VTDTNTQARSTGTNENARSEAGGQTEDPRLRLAQVGMLLSHWATLHPDSPAIISPTGDRSFAELNTNANRLARTLRRRGLGEGDAVALICTNRPEFAETVYAAQRAGFRLTPINWHLTGGEAAYIVSDCEAKALIADASIAEVAAGAVAGAGADRCTVRLAAGGPIDGFDDYAEAIAAEDGSDLADPVLGANMLYTSGTTGRPKGVHRPGRVAMAGRAQAGGGAMGTAGYRPGEDLHLCTGPLYHAAPLAFSLSAPLSFGVGTVLMERWDAETALSLIDAHRITHTHMVPTMFHRLLSLPEEVRDKYDVASLRYVIHGAAPCPVPVKQALIKWLGPIVYEYYAATEGAGSAVDSKTWLEHPGTVGKPVTEGQVKIGDADGNPLPAGEIGLVFLRAPDQGAFEYYKDPEKTANTYRGSYFTLGDVGYLDEEGYLYLTDRSANLIISGGVNIYPAEVDAVLLQHPAVGDVATIGIPNPEWGEEVKAVVELRDGYKPSEALAAELVEFCRAGLAHFKCPRSIDFIDELPRQDNGKIYKRLLRDRYRDAEPSERSN
jgi:long-chain acyl-CoA synthetase